jgi:hypothetical protein
MDHRTVADRGVRVNADGIQVAADHHVVVDPYPLENVHVSDDNL